jgi:hypothetical protein
LAPQDNALTLASFLKYVRAEPNTNLLGEDVKKRRKNMTKTLVILACLLALVTGATAQQQLNFSNLPLVNSPSLMPNSYGGLGWGNFFYVNPYGWSGAGPGYRLGPQGEDVAFVGGLFCRLNGAFCYGILSDPSGFELVSANVAGGYGPSAVTATAYNNGAYVGSMNFFVGTAMETVNFPSSWGIVTEVQLQVAGQVDDLVVYDVSLYEIVQDPPPLR